VVVYWQEGSFLSAAEFARCIHWCPVIKSHTWGGVPSKQCRCYSGTLRYSEAVDCWQQGLPDILIMWKPSVRSVVVHTCNPRYLVDGDRIVAQGQPRHKVSNMLFQKTSQAWRHTSVISAALEVEVGGRFSKRHSALLRVEASLSNPAV
jgi:hypothetical protein